MTIIRPNSTLLGLAYKIDEDKNFKKFAEEFMRSFNIGISNLKSEKQEFEEIVGEDYERIRTIFNKEENPPDMLQLIDKKGHETILEKKDGKVWATNLKITHTGKNKKEALFDLEEESDGTLRLLDFILLFKEIIEEKKVFFVDELERSIHPLLIKKLIRKFSLDENTKGQLIFTTHESNLLDQEIFRQDEVWFTEKDKDGSTDLYSLSDFKEHKTIDICKGYLNGRYGSIPFLGNLQDLNWH